MKNEVVKNAKVNTLKTKVNKLDGKTPDPTTLIHINKYNTNKKIWIKKMRDVDKNDVSGLVTTTVHDTKITKVKNKIPVASDLVKKTNYDANISEI